MADQVLQDIKDRLNVADVIAGYIPIRKAGANYKALCPFHHEKTPSLNISTAKQIWHCFGCHEGGDIFGFVMKYENVEFRDALKILADKAGVKLPTYRPENKQQQDEKELLLRINDFAARYYHQVLIEDSRGKAALEYLKNRGLTDGTIKQWQIGFAPDDFHSLERALLSKKVNLDDAVNAGVIAKNDRGMYDRFRGRVTFPIYNYFGDTVGFSARILIDDGKSAKYVNSPETAIYNKGKTLFGLNFAKESIRKQDEVIIVEGQMDCIQAHQAAFKNIIASSGTALTESGLAQISRLTKNLKFCFDADSAGQAASRRAGELALKQGFKIKVIILEATSSFAKASADGQLLSSPAEAGERKKKAKDPDELIKKSPGLWQKAVAEAVWFLDYYIDQAEVKYPAGSVEQKFYLSQQVVPFLGFIQDPLEQDHYVHKLATRFMISEKVIRDQIKQQKVGLPVDVPSAKPSTSPASLLLEKEVLGGLLTDTEFLAEVKNQLEMEDFEHQDIKIELKNLLENGSKSAETPLAKEAQFMVESQLEELDGNQTALKRELLKAFALLKRAAIKKQQQHLQTEIKMAELAKNKSKIEELTQKFNQVSVQRMKFETYL